MIPANQMFARLFLLFVLLPLADFVLLWSLIQILPIWVSLALVLGTGAVGAFFARRQGSRVLSEIRSELSDNLVPANTLLDGVMILFAGALLITPGLITDSVGLLLLVPYTRRWFRAQAFALAKRYLKIKAVNFQTQFGSAFNPGSSDIVDGEVVKDHSTHDAEIVKPKRVE